MVVRDMVRVRQFIEESGISPYELRCMAAEIDIEFRRERTRAEQEQYREIKKALVGKCYRYYDSLKDVYSYYKVVSACSVQPKYVTCLTFDEHPRYSTYSVDAVDNTLVQWKMDEYIDVMSEEVNKIIKQFVEITPEEFKRAAQNYLEELLTMEWKIDGGDQY